MKTATQRRRKQSHFGEAKRNIHCDAAICATCININKLSRVKYWGGGPWPPGPPVPMLQPRSRWYITQNIELGDVWMLPGKIV